MILISLEQLLKNHAQNHIMALDMILIKRLNQEFHTK